MQRIRTLAAVAAVVASVGTVGSAVVAPPAGAVIDTSTGARSMARVNCAPWGVSGTPYAPHYRQIAAEVVVTPESGKTSQYVTGRAYVYRPSNGGSMTTGWYPSVLATSTRAATLWFDFNVQNLAWVNASDFQVYVQLAHWTGSAWRYTGWYSASQLAGVPYRDSYGYAQSATSPYAQYSVNSPFVTEWNWSRTCSA
jgi:hypothetical protein